MNDGKRLIITADDYGMAQSVNRAIEEGIEAGLITATNVMVNMDYCREAAFLKEKYQNIAVGIHFTLSAGKPVLPAEEIPTLTGKDGKFYPYSVFRKKYRSGKILNRDILKELRAQYDKFVSVCGEPDYWNTHQNVHVDVKIFKLFADFANGLKIDRMRTHQRIYIPAQDGGKRSIQWRIAEMFKVCLLNKWMRRAHNMGIKSPDGLVVNSRKDDLFDFEYTLSNIDWKNRSTGELVIHPAIDDNCEYFGTIREKRILEYKMFSDRKTLSIINDSGIRLINFRDL